MLRVVSLNMFLPGYRLVADWADRNGHEIVLVVTLPSSAGHRYDEAANPLVVDLPEATNVLVTGRSPRPCIGPRPSSTPGRSWRSDHGRCPRT